MFGFDPELSPYVVTDTEPNVRVSIELIDAKPAASAADVDDADAPDEEVASASTIVEELLTD